MSGNLSISRQSSEHNVCHMSESIFCKLGVSILQYLQNSNMCFLVCFGVFLLRTPNRCTRPCVCTLPYMCLVCRAHIAMRLPIRESYQVWQWTGPANNYCNAQVERFGQDWFSWTRHNRCLYTVSRPFYWWGGEGGKPVYKTKFCTHCENRVHVWKQTPDYELHWRRSSRHNLETSLTIVV